MSDGKSKPSANRILIVDGESKSALAEAGGLEAEGYAVELASTADEALRRVRAGEPRIDLALIDIDLGSDGEGIEVGRKIIEISGLPIVFLSGRTDRSIVERSSQVPNYGYILKGSGPAVIAASVRLAFRLLEARAQLSEKEEALKSSEERYAKAFKCSPVAIAITHLGDEVFVDVNDAFCRMLGFEREEVVGHSSFELGIWERPEDRQELGERFRTQGALRDDLIRHRRKDGSIFTGLGSYDVIELDGERCSISVVQDLSYQVRLDRELRERETLYQTLFELVSNGALEEDFSGVKAYIEALRAKGAHDISRYLTENVASVRECSSLIRVLRSNREALRVLNIPQDGAVGSSIAPYIPDATIPVMVEEFSRIANGEKSIEIDFPNSIPEAQARFLRMRLTLVPGHEEDWKSVLVCFTDLTKEVEAERSLSALVEQKELLMRELEHRVKNNLNLVSSLLSLESAQQASESGKKVFLDAQARIRSIALIYDLLSHSAKGDRLDCKAYIEELAALIFETYASGRADISLEARIEGFEIDVKRGVSIGLLATELITNSLKYAFPDRGGRLSIDIAPRDGRLEMLFVDDGVGTPAGFDPRTASSLGFQLIGVLVQQMAGDIEVKSPPGFSVRVVIPL
jgi:PAS domain S-box